MEAAVCLVQKEQNLPNQHLVRRAQRRVLGPRWMSACRLAMAGLRHHRPRAEGECLLPGEGPGLPSFAACRSPFPFRLPALGEAQCRAST